MDDRALIFLHIPKTAGTTLNRIVEWQYNPVSIFTMDPYRIRATAQRFRTLPEGRRRRIRVVRGHLYYGIHEFLPQGATYITMLRDPVSRFLSSYYFIHRRPLHPLHRKVTEERIGIADFIRLTPYKQNFQTRLLAGVEDKIPVDEQMLKAAKEHLRKSFSIVGISERFEESLVLIAKTFGWKIPYYENRKVAKVHPKVDSTSVELIRVHNRFDLELYDYAHGLFEESLHNKKEDVREGQEALRALRRPGALQSFCTSASSAGRFLLSKLASAI